MKLKKLLSTLSVMVFTMSFSVSTNIIHADNETQIVPQLTVTPNNEANFNKLNWSMADTSQGYSYMIYSKKSTDTEFQSIPAKGTVKVLNVYPSPIQNTGLSGGGKDLDGNSIPDSGILKTWLEKENINEITIESVSLTSFNNNPSKYLKKVDGKWNYDSVFYGMWNLDPQTMYPNDTAIEYLRTFINDGGGFMTSHHTIGYRGLDRGVNKLAKELGVEIFGRAQANYNPNQPGHGRAYACRDTNGNLFPTVSFELDDPSSLPNIDNTNYWNSSSKVQLVKRGILNNYPFKVGNIGDTFDIPYQHGLSVFGKGDVWMTSVNPTGFGGGPFKEITVSPSTGAKGTNNFYLHTYNNTAIINSGHSFPQITQAETRIIANTLYYLSQVTDQTSWEDHKGQDVDAPNKPVIKSVKNDVSNNKINISCEPAVDNGSTYDYYIEAKGLTDGTKKDSATKEATITSGIKGYSIVVDKKTDTVPGNTITTTSPEYTIDKSYSSDFYVHVAAIDNAGNISEVTHQKINVRYANGIVINKRSDDLGVGETDKLTALITPSDALIKTVKWTSSDPSIVTVDDNGNITAVKAGTAIITATVQDGRNLHGQCRVCVTD